MAIFNDRMRKGLARRMYQKVLDSPFGRIAYRQFKAREDRRPTYVELHREWEMVKYNRYIQLASGTYNLPSVKLRTFRCTKPPFGWHCTREAEHEGPCAAVQSWPMSATASSPITGRMSSTESNLKDIATSFYGVERNLYQQLVEGTIAREESEMAYSVYPTITDDRNVNVLLLRLTDVPVGALVEHAFSGGRIGLRVDEGIAWFGKPSVAPARFTLASYYGYSERVFRIVHGNIHITR